VKSAPPKSSGTVFVPSSAGVKGDERATQRGVVLAAVNKYYQDKGYDFSRAAIEEAAGRLELDVKNLELTYLRDAKGDMARDASGKPIMGLLRDADAGKPEYRVFTDNPELIKALAKKGNALDIGNRKAQTISVIDTKSVRR
jgi:hypothetical protein